VILKDIIGQEIIRGELRVGGGCVQAAAELEGLLAATFIDFLRRQTRR
jgi:hypothetical protein